MLKSLMKIYLLKKCSGILLILLSDKKSFFLLKSCLFLRLLNLVHSSHSIINQWYHFMFFSDIDFKISFYNFNIGFVIKIINYIYNTF